MKSFFKWSGIVVSVVVMFVIIGVVGVYIYVPDSHQSQVKPGIAQNEIPVGIDTTVVFENVNVIPMDSERILEGQTVVIEDQRITDIGPGGKLDVPSDALIVDGEGKFLIPGLSDMQTHTFGVENDLLVYLANGVTTIRIMGEDTPTILEWRDQIKAGERTGPNIWVWWPMIENNDYESAPGKLLKKITTGGGKVYVDTPEEVRSVVAEAAALGVDGTKAHVVESTEVYQAILDAAAEHGLPFDGHAPVSLNFREQSRKCEPSECWEDFRSLKVPALTHAEELIKVVEWSDDSIQQAAQDVAEDEMWITSTAYLMRSIWQQVSDIEGTLATIPETKYVHPSVYKSIKWGPEDNHYVATIGPNFPNYLNAVEKMILALSESGALIMSGTDVPLPLMVPGFSLHNELETLVDIGLSPYDVLRTSTYNPALYLGELREIGTVEVGKRADLVLLDENPLESITNTRQIAGVMVRGSYYSRADLDVMLDSVAQDYEGVKITQTRVRTAYPVMVGLLLMLFVGGIVRKVRQGGSKIESV